MTAYVVKRLAAGVIVLLLVMVFLSLLVQLVPGDPARIILGTHATPQLISQVQRELGLDQSIPAQIWKFVFGVVRGNLGTDFITQAPVASELGTPLLNTLVLTVASVVLAIVVGIPMGIASAIRPGRLADYSIRAASVILLSAPAYVVGLLLLLAFAVNWHLVPALGSGSFSDPLDYLRRLIMPCITLAAFWWAYLARLVRASMLEVLGQPFVRTARAYGLSEPTIRYRVALKNALIPITGLTGVMLGYVLAGTVYVEVIFGRTGLGTLAVAGIGNRDWPVVRAVVLIYAAGFIVGSLLADVAYRLLDPRLRLEESVEVFV